MLDWLPGLGFKLVDWNGTYRENGGVVNRPVISQLFSCHLSWSLAAQGLKQGRRAPRQHRVRIKVNKIKLIVRFRSPSVKKYKISS